MPRNGGLLEGDSKWAWVYLAGEIAAFAGYIGALLLLITAGYGQLDFRKERRFRKLLLELDEQFSGFGGVSGGR